jgi:hypothetical protein
MVKGYRVRLSPIACRLDDLGLPLPEMDEDWFISQSWAEAETIQISLYRSSLHRMPQTAAIIEAARKSINVMNGSAILGAN